MIVYTLGHVTSQLLSHWLASRHVTFNRDPVGELRENFNDCPSFSVFHQNTDCTGMKIRWTSCVTQNSYMLH